MSELPHRHPHNGDDIQNHIQKNFFRVRTVLTIVKDIKFRNGPKTNAVGWTHVSVVVVSDIVRNDEVAAVVGKTS